MSTMKLLLGSILMTAVFPPSLCARDRVSETAPVVALNQIGYRTRGPKRFTAPLTPDGTPFVIRRKNQASVLYRGQVQNHIGDFSAFEPPDSPASYLVEFEGPPGFSSRSHPFLIRANLWQEKYWRPAIDFMNDCRSVTGSHPSAFGGTPWRDGTYYDFAAPSLILLYLADPAYHQALPRRIDWNADRRRVMDSAFVFHDTEPGSEGVLDAARRYFTELDPPNPLAPDALKLVHWGLGFWLMKPVSQDPSSDPRGETIHGQTVEQFAYLLAAWPSLRPFLPQSFYERCRDFAFANWESSGCFDIDPLWHPETYISVADMSGDNPMGGFLHPYKGRHAPGHSIQPNLLMYRVALRENRPDAKRFLQAAVRQTRWVIDHLDWRDPRTTKGHRMSEFRTIAGLAYFLEHEAEHAPRGLRAKIRSWAEIAVVRSENLWDFRRFDLEAHWSIPKLNEPGNLAGFPAAALPAARVVDDPALSERLHVLAVAQIDNLFGRNPQLAAAATYVSDRDFPDIEVPWPQRYKPDVCARIETTRGALCASPGSEKYPFRPDARFRHAEGWVNFNTAWNASLAEWHRHHRRAPPL